MNSNNAFNQILLYSLHLSFYLEYKTNASVEMEFLLIDVYNFESNQGVVNESKIADWKAVLAQARKRLYNSYEKQS